MKSPSSKRPAAARKPRTWKGYGVFLKRNDALTSPQLAFSTEQALGVFLKRGQAARWCGLEYKSAHALKNYYIKRVTITESSRPRRRK